MRTATGPLERPLVSVVAPCYNEADGLGEFHRRVSAACRAAVDDSYEIVVVNDGSRDATWDLIAKLSQQDPHVVGINLSRNHGHQIALTAGLSQAKGERIFILDADLQDPPELLSKMMAEMDGGADVVYGRRRSRKGESWFKLATASAFYRCLHALTDVDIPLDTGDFRLMSRRAVKALMRMPEQHRFIRGMVTWLGFRQVAIEYDRDERLAGETHYPLHRMVRLAFDAITGFSIQPLRAASLFGVTVGLAGLAMLVRSLYVWFTHETVPGWTSLITVVLLLGSVQLLFLGVLGEYVGRLFMESKRRPLFIISDVVGRENAARAWRKIERSPGSGLVAMPRTTVGRSAEDAVAINARKAG
jgi:dolichol-phosphate mannosyltransferase